MDTDALSHYDYTLPPELIASRPMERREDARLMVVRRASGTIEHRFIRDIPELLNTGDCLVMNNTRVVPARLKGVRTQTGGNWEGLFLEPVSPAEQPECQEFAKYGQNHTRWHILGSTRGKLQPGESVTLLDRYAHPVIRLRMEKKIKQDGSWLCLPLRDSDPVEDSCWDILQIVGSVPIPPYIRGGKADESDTVNYQTVYAQVPGAVAAPTAGLHFTDSLLQQIRDKGVSEEFVTLHVGIGTFRPISVENLAQHEMHREWAQLTPETAAKLQQCRANGGRIVAVGTTSTRVLESSQNLAPFSGYTNLFIRPPYQFHAIDALITNFHLPKSSLLVMIRTFGGDELLQQAYQEAIAMKYRFYSYGDAMMIL